MFKSLRTVSFRNLDDVEIDVFGKDVFFVGENGQGKTNFLEALYFCSYASSFRGVKDRDIVRADLPEKEKDFSAAVELCPPDSAIHRTIFVKYENSRKSIILDGKKIEDRKDLLETVPCVVFCHEDMEFVSGSQERRRWFFDQTRSFYDPVYLDDLRKYRRVLKTRNAVLKECRLGVRGRSSAEDILDALDPQLAEYGLRLMKKRQGEAERFSLVFGALYEEVSGIDGVGVAYLPSWKSVPPDSQGAAAGYLAARREADISFGLTAAGPHRDRYLFVRKGAGGGRQNGDFSGAASTGQRRLLALLLRVAQARSFSDMTGKMPVLLLDDVLLELDGDKRGRFLAVMPRYEQAFFTFLPEEPYDRYRKSDTIVYYVNGGTAGREKA
ncbi:MAG: DNA replication and repair protein RecF [Treponema sp.]|jgi:DNA replication and repair protein RecF|nr:DNA replication and repair protein RecF [Treponema sp.]